MAVQQNLMSCLDALFGDLTRAKAEIVDVRLKLHHIEAIVDNALAFTGGKEPLELPPAAPPAPVSKVLKGLVGNIAGNGQ